MTLKEFLLRTFTWWNGTTFGTIYAVTQRGYDIDAHARDDVELDVPAVEREQRQQVERQTLGRAVGKCDRSVEAGAGAGDACAVGGGDGAGGGLATGL